MRKASHKTTLKRNGEAPPSLGTVRERVIRGCLAVAFFVVLGWFTKPRKIATASRHPRAAFGPAVNHFDSVLN